MFDRLVTFWDGVRTSLLFLPLLMCAGAFLGGWLAAWLDFHVIGRTGIPWLSYSGNLEDAKELLGILLTSVITITTLSISLTFVVITLGASQLGPRLIRSFTRDIWTQASIGAFFAVIVYCFVILRVLHIDELGGSVPGLSVNLAALFSFLILFVMLFFVHHVARSTVSDTIVRRVNAELLEAIAHLAEPEHREGKNRDWPEDFDDRARPTTFERSGYIQRVNYRALTKLAEAHDLWIQLDLRAGRFVLRHQTALCLYPEERVTEDIDNAARSHILIGEERTPTQDLEYSMRHLVEIAIRALGPTNRDPYTAMAVVNNLSVALVRLFTVHKPDNDYYDSQGVLRVSGVAVKDRDIVNAAFSQIRQEAAGQPDILVHILYAIEAVGYSAVRQEQKDALKDQAYLINSHFAKTDDICEADRKDIERAYKRALKILNHRDNQSASPLARDKEP